MIGLMCSSMGISRLRHDCHTLLTEKKIFGLVMVTYWRAPTTNRSWVEYGYEDSCKNISDVFTETRGESHLSEISLQCLGSNTMCQDLYKRENWVELGNKGMNKWWIIVRDNNIIHNWYEFGNKCIYYARFATIVCIGWHL